MDKRKTAGNSTYAQVGTTEGSERTEFFRSFVDGSTGRWFSFAAQCIAAKRYLQSGRVQRLNCLFVAKNATIILHCNE
jgi:hypothetical protein